jgi:hypothetical protein
VIKGRKQKVVDHSVDALLYRDLQLLVSLHNIQHNGWTKSYASCKHEKIYWLIVPVEVFKFGCYVFFPILAMLKFGDPEW